MIGGFNISVLILYDLAIRLMAANKKKGSIWRSG